MCAIIGGIMSNRKILKDPVFYNFQLERASKAQAREMAVQRGDSLARFMRILVEDALKRLSEKEEASLL
jgi:hypothetical protein